MLIALAGMAVVAGVMALRLSQHGITVGQARREAAMGCRDVAADFSAHRSNLWVTASALVSRLLPDEYGTYQHQRFIVRCPSGQTVEIVNDVSVGQRVPVRVADAVVVHGIYIWNDLGGLIHYTHHDGGQGGWILLGSRLYE